MIITITIPDDVKAAELAAAVCDATGWTAASGITKKQWCVNMMLAYLKNIARQGYVKEGLDAINANLDSISMSGS